MARDVFKIAYSLRLKHWNEIPKTESQYLSRNGTMSANQMAGLIQQETGLTRDAALNVCAQVSPELFMAYWRNAK